MELQELTKEYLDEIKYSIKKKTYLFYLQICENHISRFKEVMTTNSLNNFIIAIKDKYSYSTTKLIKGLINRTLKYAYEKSLIEEEINITVQLKQQKSKKIEALDKHEQEKIEAYILDNKRVY